MSELKNWSSNKYSLRDDYGILLIKKFKEGSFSIVRKNQKDLFSENIYNCREEFQSVFFRRKRIIFTVKNEEQAKNVAKLIHLVEKDLKLKDKTKCGMTDNPNAMWLFIGKFWSIRAVRRTFFTAVLRAGLKYNDNLDLYENLFNCDYLKRTKKAVKHFMKGNTKSTTVIRGWYQTFYYGRGIPSGRLRKFSGDSTSINKNINFITDLLVKK